MNLKTLWTIALAASLSLGIAACEKKGPLEQAGEEVDEAVDTMKNGGESLGSKIDDTMDEARDAVEEVKEH